VRYDRIKGKIILKNLESPSLIFKRPSNNKILIEENNSIWENPNKDYKEKQNLKIKKAW